MSNSFKPSMPLKRTSPQQVEVARVSPDEFQRPKPVSEKDLMSQLEAISSTPSRAAPPPMPEATVQTAPPPPPRKEEPIIENDVLDDLLAEYGVTSSTADVVIEADGRKMKVSVRKPKWDDHNWVMFLFEKTVKSSGDKVRVLTEKQRGDFYEAAMSCRRVVAINGIKVWDYFKCRAEIESRVAGWDGEDHTRVPLDITGRVSEQVFELFRNLDPDFLIDLNDKIQSAFSPKVPEKKAVPEDRNVDDEEVENPTPAT